MSAIVFTPLVPWPVIAILGGATAILLAVALVRRARGATWRAIAMLTVILALLDPHVMGRETVSRPDEALIVVDVSPSQSIGERQQQTAAARAALRGRLAALPNLILREVETVGDGTRLFAALSEGLSEIPSDRFAGAIVITDGQAHDVPETAPAPVHVLLTGNRGETDRRIAVTAAPRYSMVGQGAEVVAQVDDAGGGSAPVPVRVIIDGVDAGTLNARPGVPLRVPVPINHAGANVVELEAAPLSGEVSSINNRALARINGVRDRLRVLLVSGQPHPGERTWRNLLKSDPAVDLVHFTILRPPEKDDFTPLNELALITFPTRELFEEKLREFDLIVFDRYVVRDILSPFYFDNIRDHVTNGGAVLFAVGPEFAGLRSLYGTSLADIMPATPTGGVIERGFKPTPTDAGRRHPVTRGLDRGGSDTPAWGRWFRQIETTARRGSVLLEGADSGPLLVLDRVGAGRIGLIASDHIWLWARGFEGGGPHAEFIRRLVHWLMKEPDLEEESLRARVIGETLVIERHGMNREPATLTITHPSGATEDRTVTSDAEGRAEIRVKAAAPGFYRVADGGRIALAGSGNPDGPEFADLRADATRLEPVVTRGGGGVHWLVDGMPDIRRVRAGYDSTGRDWIGLVRNEAVAITGITRIPLLPGIAVLLLALGALAVAWWREGR